MIAIAWIDSPAGRRFRVVRGAWIVLVGSVTVAIGRFSHPWLVWGGVGLIALAVTTTVWGLTHPASDPFARPCVIPGCRGTMRQKVKARVLNQTVAWEDLEWQCNRNPSHIVPVELPQGYDRDR